MPRNSIGPIGQAWLKWKSLRLPWRKRFLVGFDLEGNTYWEFRLTTRGTGEATPDALGDVERWRRIVKYPRSTHYSAVKVSPLWHQWLRYTRRDPPSLQEQRGDIARQDQIRRLAADADARWKAKPRVMEDPVAAPAINGSALPENITETSSTTTVTTATTEAVRQQAVSSRGQAAATEDDEAFDPKDPWKQARARGPGEGWQPDAWAPTSKKQ